MEAEEAERRGGEEKAGNVKQVGIKFNLLEKIHHVFSLRAKCVINESTVRPSSYHLVNQEATSAAHARSQSGPLTCPEHEKYEKWLHLCSRVERNLERSLERSRKSSRNNQQRSRAVSVDRHKGRSRRDRYQDDLFQRRLESESRPEEQRDPPEYPNDPVSKVMRSSPDRSQYAWAKLDPNRYRSRFLPMRIHDLVRDDCAYRRLVKM